MLSRLSGIALVGLAATLGLAAEPPAPVKPAAAATKAPAPSAVTPAKTGAISGRVTAPDGKPLSGASVRAMATVTTAQHRRGERPEAAKIATASTLADGTFKLDGLARETYTVRVEAPGWAPALAEKVPLGASLGFTLEPGLTVVGRVLDLTTQKPISGATVRALEHEASAFGLEAAHTARSGDDGSFAIPDCAPGIAALDAVAPGRTHARLENVVVKKPSADEAPKPDANTLFLRPGGRIAGRVVGSDGKPIADASVSVAAGDGAVLSMLRDAPRPQRTDASGRFDFDGLPAGNRWTLRARKSGLADAETPPISVDAGTDRADVEIRLESGAVLTVRLLTADDAPVTDVEISVRPSSASGTGTTPRPRSFLSMGGATIAAERIASKDDGTLSVRNLEAGLFDVTFSPADYADVVKEAVRLRAGEAVDLGTLRVKESKSVSGRISDAFGQPVAGATVSTFWLDGASAHSREAKSKPDGRYKLSGLGDEPLRDMWASADGYATARKEGSVPGDTSADFVLDRLGSATGRVLMPDGSAPPAFRVTSHAEAKEGQERPGFRMVVGMGPSDADKVFVDPSGSFRVDDLAPGKVTLEARAEGLAPGRKTGIEIRSDQVVDVGTITLQNGRTLRGRVLAAKDDAPVPGASVTLGQAQGFMVRMGATAVDALAVTRIDGTFQIEGLEPRSYTVATTQPDYSPATGRVEIPADQDVDDFVVRLSKGGILTGLVRDAQKQPVPNVQVLVSKMPMSGGPQTATSGPDGRYTIEKLPPGEYIVMKAPAPGQPLMLMSGMKQASVSEGTTTEFNLDDASKINLSGRVLRGGQPVAGAMVLLSAGGFGGGAGLDVKTTKADESGRYQVGLDVPGSYGAMVSSSGGYLGSGSTVTIEVPDQPSPVVDIQIKTSGISGRVVSSDGKPVGSAFVTAVPAEGDRPQRPYQAGSEADGGYRIESLDPGAYKVTAAAAGYRNAEVGGVKVAADVETPGVDFRLESARSVKGHVVDPGGRGIGGAIVVVAGSGTLPAGRDGMPATSDVNGAFVLTAPVDGPLDLTAVAQGYAPARASGVVPTDDLDVTLQSPRGGRIRVTVTGANGQPVAGASISCSAAPEFLGSAMANFVNRPAPTGIDGVSIVGPLSPGGYDCAARLGTKTISKAVAVDDGGETVVPLVLP